MIADQGQKDFAIILAEIRDTAIFNRLYIKLYIKFVANNGKNRDSIHAAISFCPCNIGTSFMSRIIVIYAKKGKCSFQVNLYYYIF